MRKGIVVLLIIAAALTLVGVTIAAVGIAAMDDTDSLVGERYQTKIYKADDEINGISIDGDVAHIKLLPYDKEGYLVRCFEEKKLHHSVNVKDGILCIEKRDTREWYDHIYFFSKPTLVTVYVPAGDYSSLTVRSDTGDIYITQDFTFNKADISCSTGDVKLLASTKSSLNIKASTGSVTVGDGSNTFTHSNVSITTSTGNITANKLSCKNVTLSVSTGKTRICDVICDNLTSTGNTGDILMSSFIVNESLSIKRSTGDVKFDKCDAAKLDIVTDTGDVIGSFLSEKVFIYKTDTGNVNLPQTTTGGTCKISTDTGDIKISIEK